MVPEGSGSNKGTDSELVRSTYLSFWEKKEAGKNGFEFCSECGSYITTDTFGFRFAVDEVGIRSFIFKFGSVGKAGGIWIFMW